MNKDFDTTPRSQRRRESQGLLDEGVTDEERKAMDDSALETRFSLASSPGIFEALKFRFGDMRMVSMRKKLVESFRAAAEGNVQALRAFLSEDGGNRDILDERGLAALHYAARYNQHAAVTLLLDFGANIDVRAADGCSPLHQAVRYNAQEAVEQLLTRQADVTLKAHSTGATALHIAADFGHHEIVERLLSVTQCRIDGQDSQGYTPLHLACLRGHQPVCELLLRKGASLEMQSAAGLGVLHFAASSADPEIVKLVLNAASRLLKDSNTAKDLEKLQWLVNMRDAEMKTPLHVATQAGNIHVAQALLEHGADVHAKKKNLQTSAHLAACRGKAELLSLMVSKGADLNTQDEQQRTPLHSAVWFGNKDAASVLIDNGAQLEARDHDGLTPFLCAVQSGQTECVNLLLESGADTGVRDKHMRNCLHLAVRKEQESVVKLLISKAGTKLMNHPDDEVRTPLHYAAVAYNVKILEILLMNPGNCFTNDASQKSPLHLAAESGKERHVEALAKASISCVFSRDSFDRTPLHSSIIRRKRAAAAVLIGLGSDLTSPDVHGWTPLMWAAISGSPEIAKMLLEQGVSPDDVDKSGNTALHLACHHGNVELVNLLLDYNAGLPLNDSGDTCLDVAMEQNSYDVVTKIVKHKRWQEFVSIIGPHGKRPIERLIQHYPEAAALVMDRCITRSSPDSPERTITYDFRLLDSPPEAETKDGKRFSGMMTMVNSNQSDLLSHPLARKLLGVKWETFGRYVFWGNFALYVTFITLLTVFLLSERKEVELDDPKKGKHRPTKPPKFFEQKNEANNVITWVLVIFAIAHILKEIFQIISQKLNYLRDPVNFLEWALYTTTILFLVPYMAPAGSSRFLDTPEVYWHLGTISVFLGYVDAILFLQTIGFLGLYITMFIEVSKTVFKALGVIILFVLAFAMVFFILLKEQESFDDFDSSVMRVLVMSIGEFDYVTSLVDTLDQVSNETGADLVPYPEMTNFFFFLFVLIMPIILMNLLIGLAVGDIESVRRHAYIRKKARKIMFVVDVEKSFPMFIRRWLYKPRIVVSPVEQTHTFWRFTKELTDVYLPPERHTVDPEELHYAELKAELKKNKQKMRAMMTSIEQLKDIMLETKANQPDTTEVRF